MRKASDAGAEFIRQWEKLRLNAYLDVADVPTIGWGTTRYPPWHPVRPRGRVELGDVCTPEQAWDYFRYDLRTKERAVDDLTTDKVRQEQFDALVSLVYNIGQDAYKDSTIRRMVNANPDNPLIRAQFKRWIWSGGEKREGLLNRRVQEADMYFSGISLAG
jgi:lysozyme